MDPEAPADHLQPRPRLALLPEWASGRGASLKTAVARRQGLAVPPRSKGSPNRHPQEPRRRPTASRAALLSKETIKRAGPHSPRSRLRNSLAPEQRYPLLSQVAIRCELVVGKAPAPSARPAAGRAARRKSACRDSGHQSPSHARRLSPRAAPALPERLSARRAPLANPWSQRSGCSAVARKWKRAARWPPRPPVRPEPTLVLPAHSIWKRQPSRITRGRDCTCSARADGRLNRTLQSTFGRKQRGYG